MHGTKNACVSYVSIERHEAFILYYNLRKKCLKKLSSATAHHLFTFDFEKQS